MKPVFSIQILQLLPFVILSIALGNANSAFAQASNIVPDNTLGAESSQVSKNADGFPIEIITGGAQREQNLFHSFQEFNVSEGRGAYFNSPNADIQNIFSRVTGNNPSEILGVLGTFGESNPNLYLINPNGIIFGNNASLDVGGSFTATTADGIIFQDNSFFSAVNPQESILTISVPLGLQLGSNPGSIINRSFSQDEGDFVGLQVPAGKNLTFVGGDIVFEIGHATARGGNILIGGLSAAGTVLFDENGNLSFPQDVVRGDISFSRFSEVDVTGTGGGKIGLKARNLTVKAGNLNLGSAIRAGIATDSIASETQAGDIAIDATEGINIDNSIISNSVSSGAEGNAGNIQITTDFLTLSNGGIIEASTFGRGDAGKIEIFAEEIIAIDGKNSIDIPSSILSVVASEAAGNTGGVQIGTSSLTLSNGGVVSASILGRGDAGKIEIFAEETIAIEGDNSTDTPNGILSLVDLGAIGNLGSLDITTRNLTLNDNGNISSSTFGQGNASKINIRATNFIEILNQGKISSEINSRTFGSSGIINLKTPSLILNDLSSISTVSIREGNGSDINLDTNFVKILNGSTINSSTFLINNLEDNLANSTAGNINIEAGKLVEISGINSGLITSFVGRGNSGNISINTNNLLIKDNALISSSKVENPDDAIANNLPQSDRQNNSGNIFINASESVTISDANGILTSGTGNATGGNVSISTPQLKIKQSSIETGTIGNGNSGNLSITDANLVEIIGGTLSSRTAAGSTGNGGMLKISTDNLIVQEEGLITTLTQGKGNGGIVEIDTNFVILQENSTINSLSKSEGKSGNISISLIDNLELDNSSINSNSVRSTGGQISLTARKINLRGSSEIGTKVEIGEGNGGNISLTADLIIAFDDSDIFAFAADGRGGNINLNTDAFFAENFTLNSLTANPNLLENNNRADVNATGAVSGSVSIPDVSFLQNALTELNNNAINTDQLLANSCVVPHPQREGIFIITGTGGLAVNPDDEFVSSFPTGDVETIKANNSYQWQPHEPIIEPQGVYHLSDGRLILSRECEQ